MRLATIDKLKIIYIVTMMVAFTTNYGDYKLGFYLQSCIGLVWIGLAILKYLKKKDISIKLLDILKMYLIPHVFIHLYTIILMILGFVSWDMFSTNISVYVPTLFVIAAIYLFGKSTLYLTFLALLGSWFLSVLSSVILIGPGIIPDAIEQAYFGNVYLTNYLELHDIVLAIGYLVLFYIILEFEWMKKHCAISSIVLIIMLLGLKRIQIIALLLAFGVYFVIRRFEESKRYKTSIILGIIGIIGCYIYIYMLSSSEIFFEILDKLGISSMGRNYYYKVILDLADFSVDFIGLGRNAVSKILTTDYSYLNVGGVHSDIIKMYVECGFIVFGLWLWYKLVNITRYFNQKFSYNVAVFYFITTIYTFVLYFTDNTEVYFISQIFSMMTVVTCAMKESKKEQF